MMFDDDEDLGGGEEEDVRFHEPHRQLQSLGHLRGMELGLEEGERDGFAHGYREEAQRAFQFGRLMGLAKAVIALLPGSQADSLKALVARVEQQQNTADSYWQSAAQQHPARAEFERTLEEIKTELRRVLPAIQTTD